MIALLYSFRTSAYKVHTEIGKLYDVLAYTSAAVYTGYIVFWGTSEGGHITTADQEIIVYTVLDIVSKVVFAFILIFGREAIARHGSFLGSSATSYDLPATAKST